MADTIASFAFTTQEDWYGELTFESAEDGSALSLAGRQFVMPITPARSGAQLVEPMRELSTEPGGELALKEGEPSTLIFRIPRDTAREWERTEFTADIIEVTGSARQLFLPVRVSYVEPSGLRSFMSRFLGVKVSFARRVQPIITPVAVAGRQGARGPGILSGDRPPTAGDGAAGDFWIDLGSDTQAPRLYPPKTSAGWADSFIELITDQILSDALARAAQVSSNRFSVQDGNLAEGQAALPIPGGYTPGVVMVFRNGVLLQTKDYTAVNGTDVVLSAAARADDVIDVRGFQVGGVIDAAPTQHRHEVADVLGLAPRLSAIAEAVLDANESAALDASGADARQPYLAAGIGAPDLPSAAAVDAYAGPAREIIAGPEDLRLQDGQTPGGIRILSLGSKVLATFAGALPIPLWKVLFANVHAVHFGVEAIPADAPASQRVSQTARLRAAIAFAEARGAHLNLPQGDIWFGAPPDDTDACLRIGKNMSMSGAGFDTRLMPLPDVAGRHLLMIKPLANTPIQGMSLAHFTIGAVGAGQPGLNALRIETTNAGGYIAGLDVGHIALSPGGPTNRAFEHFNSDDANKNGGVFGSTFHNLTVVGGMKFTKTGDSNNIFACRISNHGIGIDLSTTSGAATQCIMFNNITSHGGAMRLNGVLQGHIRFNQCEQSFPYTGDTSNDNACITFIGCSQCTAGDNNINTHGRCDAVALIGSPDCTIYPNTLCYGDGNFAVRAKFSTGLRFDRQTKDIIFNGQDNAGSSRKFPLVSIDASSSPVIGLPMVQTLKGGFTDAGGANLTPGLRATLQPSGSVHLSGNLNGGVDASTNTRKQGTVLATLPDAMRPNKARYLPVIVNQPGVGFSNGMLVVDTVGGISVVSMPLGAFGLDSLSFRLD